MATTKNVYALQSRKFKGVSAFVIMKGGKHVASVTLKFPKDGMGKLHGFMHCIGTEMVTASCSGCGYDKCTAVIVKLADEMLKQDFNKVRHADYFKLLTVLSDSEAGWKEYLYDNNFQVIQVI